MSRPEFYRHVRKQRYTHSKSAKIPGYSLPVLLAGILVAVFTVLKPGSENDHPLSIAISSSTNANAYYQYCDEARAAGAAPMHRGHPGYRAELDRDGDGVACEPYYGR
jgi:Excalibur calcium-binding domain